MLKFNGNTFTFNIKLHPDIHQVIKKSESFEKPYNYNNHNDNIQYVLNLTIHWDVSINYP